MELSYWIIYLINDYETFNALIILYFLWKCYNLWWLPPGYVSFAHFLRIFNQNLACGTNDMKHIKQDFSLKIVSMIRKYHNHKSQTIPWHREEEPLNHQETPVRQIK